MRLPLLCALSLVVTATAQDAASWWAWRPLLRPPVPDVGADAFVSNDVDRFVLAQLRERGLRPAAPASRTALIRRLSYDLTGLGPSPADVAAFAADDRPTAYAELVERLLASPQYGVHQARHWLDLARFAETNSFERDGRKPAAWRYRDWVVDAFNRDLPWADFLVQQLAGDELPDADVATVTATGFLRLGLWDDEPTDALQAVYDDLDSIADTTARAMLGISMGCARCHDHKKDPISTRDYYAFLAFFENLRPYRPLGGNGGALSPENYTRTLPVAGALGQQEAATAAWRAERGALAARAAAAADAGYRQLSPRARVALLADAERGLVARYSADRSDAQQLRDDVAHRDGAIEGQVVPVDGRVGTALRFDGDDRVVLPLLVRDSFTIAFWVRSHSHGRGDSNDPRWYFGDGLVDGEVHGEVADFGIAWLGDGCIAAGTGAPDTFVASPPGHADGQWHHVAFTRDAASGRIALYVDGALAGAATGSTAPLDAPPRLVVGDLQPGDHGFTGDLDELCFFDRALAPAEVVASALQLRGGVAAAAACGDGGSALTAFAALPEPVVATATVLCARETGARPAPSFVRIRGDVHQQGEAVVPAFPAVFGAGPPRIEPQAFGQSSGRRTALARWITAADNALCWRVAANRIWQHHFGRGLCRTPNDFGRLGEQPTHSALLDWLACELVARGGSSKAMHRLIVMSGAYRMACAEDAAALAQDPQNDAFWRFDRRRLSAEELRDSMLAAAGTLDLRIGGPSVYPPLPKAVLATSSRPDEAWGTSSPQDAARRSLFVHQKRSLQEPLLAAFDLADPDSSCPVRFATVQPTQALMLLNGEFAQATAAALARRLEREADGARAQLERGLWLTTCRPPLPAEVDRLLALHAELCAAHGRSPADALQRCCLVLLNQNEFVYLD